MVYAKTDKYYIKKFEAETNITGYLVMDLSRSMAYTYRQTADQVRLWHLPGRRTLLPDGPSAGPGGADHVRRKDPRLPAAPFQANANRQYPVAAVPIPALRQNSIARSLIRWRPCCGIEAW